MRAILVFVVSSLFPVVTFAQPLTPEEEEELRELREIEIEEELALRQAMRDTPVESMNAPAWCFQYRFGREVCFNNVMLAERMLELARSRGEASREGNVEAAAWFAETFETARTEGVRGWCERLRQVAFDYGNTRELFCRQANEVFVVTARSGTNETERVWHVSSDFIQAWRRIQDMTECNIATENACYSNIRIRKLVYTP